ncbi:uncharacterized protein G2W53_009837 [Senna tora]|uniref:Uncharacterized protein n=1 Tax=Senna tora TaxID=362788 RepID=A0A834WZ29_9FABA|nr:uncharacterized protein G2W53_009837 [Senna tora]
MGGAWIMSQHTPDDKSQSDLKNLHELQGKKLVAKVSQTRRFANRSRFEAPIGVVLAWEERGSCLNVFRKTNRGLISETFTNYEAKDLLRKKLHELRGKRLVAQVSQTRRFANESGFDAPIRVISAWEERGSCLNIFRTRKRGRISEAFTNYEAKDLLRKNLHGLRSKTLVVKVSQTRRFANRSGFDAPIGIVVAWEERGSCLNIFRMTNRGRISETFMNYEAKDLLRNFDAPIGVVLAWEECGSCLNIFRTTNRGWISETFTNYEAKRHVAQVSQTRRFALYSRTGVVLMLRLESSWHGRSMDHVLTYSGRQITVGSQKPSRITRQKTCCASESNTSVRVVFANGSGFNAPIGVVLAWEERGSCLTIFRTTNRNRISETFTNYEAKDLLRKVVLMLRLESSSHGRSVDNVLTYFGRQIAVGSQKPSRITRQKTCCASESNTSVGVVFANRSGFDAPIGVVLACEERGSCLNIFQTTNLGRISETFTNYEAKDLLCKNLDELRGKRLVAQVRQSRLFALYSRTGLCLMLRLESSWHGRSVDHFLTYSGLQIAVGSQKPSQITRQKTCCASESNTSVRVVFANRSGFDAPIGVVLAWEERGSCLNIFRTTNHGRISETFTNYEAKDLLRNRLGMGGAGIMSQHIPNDKPRSDLRNLHELRGKRLFAQVSQTRRFANRSGFDAPIGVVLPWEEHGSCLSIFRTTNRGRIIETFTNYEAKDLLRKNLHELRGKRLVAQVSQTRRFANESGFDAPIGVVLAWEERGSCLNIFRTTNHGRISETFTNYEAKDLLRK